MRFLLKALALLLMCSSLFDAHAMLHVAARSLRPMAAQITLRPAIAQNQYMKMAHALRMSSQVQKAHHPAVISSHKVISQPPHHAYFYPLSNKISPLSYSSQKNHHQPKFIRNDGWALFAAIVGGLGLQICKDVYQHISQKIADKKMQNNPHDAIINSDIRRLKAIIKKNKKALEQPDKFGHTPLITALINKNEAAAIFLIIEGANVNVENKEEKDALCIANEQGLANIAEKIHIILAQNNVKPLKKM